MIGFLPSLKAYHNFSRILSPTPLNPHRVTGSSKRKHGWLPHDRDISPTIVGSLEWSIAGNPYSNNDDTRSRRPAAGRRVARRAAVWQRTISDAGVGRSVGGGVNEFNGRDVSGLERAGAVKASAGGSFNPSVAEESDREEENEFSSSPSQPAQLSASGNAAPAEKEQQMTMTFSRVVSASLFFALLSLLVAIDAYIWRIIRRPLAAFFLSLPFLMSAVLSASLGFATIPLLRSLKARQVIREEGPQSHQSKAGTPTMGGIFLVPSGLLIARLASGWPAELWGPVAATCAMMGVGAIDDGLSLWKKHNYGLPGGVKLLLQVSAWDGRAAGCVAHTLWGTPPGAVSQASTCYVVCGKMFQVMRDSE